MAPLPNLCPTLEPFMEALLAKREGILHAGRGGGVLARSLRKMVVDAWWHQWASHHYFLPQTNHAYCLSLWLLSVAWQCP